MRVTPLIFSRIWLYQLFHFLGVPGDDARNGGQCPDSCTSNPSPLGRGGIRFSATTADKKLQDWLSVSTHAQSVQSNAYCRDMGRNFYGTSQVSLWSQISFLENVWCSLLINIRKWSLTYSQLHSIFLTISDTKNNFSNYSNLWLVKFCHENNDLGIWGLVCGGQAKLVLF